MGVHDYSVWIAASPEQVWSTYVDPMRIPQWQTGRPHIEEVHGEAGEPGSTYVSRRGPLAARTVVVASDVPSRLETRTDAYLGMLLTVTSRLAARAGGTELSMTAQTRWPPGRRLVGRVVDRVVLSPREAHKELAKLKRVVEGDAIS